MPDNAGPVIVRTQTIEWSEGEHRGLKYRFKDLSGEHLGARIEELAPGNTSSNHHYHTVEEEHVFVLSGEAVLVCDEGEYRLTTGDHVCFRAGEALAHHLKNDTDVPCTYLVYGERKAGDVVVYPDHGVMLVKALGLKKFSYRPADG